MTAELLVAGMDKAKAVGPANAPDEWSALARAITGTTNLVILAGSGTSRGLTGDSGARVAPMMGDLMTLVQGLPGYAALASAHPDLSTLGGVEDLLSRVQSHAAIAGSGSDEEAFIVAATEAIRHACDFVDESTDLSSHEELIRSLAVRESRQERLEVFTTNYDLAFESAFQRTGFIALDGFGYGSRAIFNGQHLALDIVDRSPRGELTLSPRVLKFMKLHGSVDWEDSSLGVVRDAHPTSPVLIYPSSNKYQQSYRQPYFEAMARFTASMRRRDTCLIVIGFGFKDDHINRPIFDALKGDPSMRLVVVDPFALEPGNPTFEKLQELVRREDARIALFAGGLADFAEALPIGKVEPVWDAVSAAVSEVLK